MSHQTIRCAGVLSILFLFKNLWFFLRLESSLFVLRGLGSGPSLPPREPNEPPNHLYTEREKSHTIVLQSAIAISKGWFAIRTQP